MGHGSRHSALIPTGLSDPTSGCDWRDGPDRCRPVIAKMWPATPGAKALDVNIHFVIEEDLDGVWPQMMGLISIYSKLQSCAVLCSALQ